MTKVSPGLSCSLGLMSSTHFPYRAKICETCRERSQAREHEWLILQRQFVTARSGAWCRAGRGPQPRSFSAATRTQTSRIPRHQKHFTRVNTIIGPEESLNLQPG